MLALHCNFFPDNALYFFNDLKRHKSQLKLRMKQIKT